MDVITRVKGGGFSQASVSRDKGIPESTIRGWIKDEQKLRDFVDTVDSSDGMQRKKARTANDPELDKAVFSWFVKERQAGTPISGPVLSMQAQKFHSQLHADNSGDFVASKGWLNRFQHRHGISQVKINGESRSADTTAADEFIPIMKTYMADNDLLPEQIYNADETALYYRMLQDKTLSVKTDVHKHDGFKQSKDRVTLLLCSNKTGTHKLNPLCIGKFAKPRCFHHVNMSSMPVDYTNSKNAWMTSVIFKDWFSKTFVPQVRKHLRKMKVPVKAVLLLDNCPAHPPAETLQSRDGKIKVLYLPKNTTSKIQPLDQGIISSLKRHYRRELIKDIVCTDLSVVEFVKKMNLKDMFFLTAKAWGQVTPTTISNCWDHALKGVFTADVEEDVEDDEFHGFTDEEVRKAEDKLRTMMDTDQNIESYINECATLEDDCPVHREVSDEDIIKEVQAEVEEVEEVEETQEVETKIPSATEAAAGLQAGLQWLETQEIDPLKLIQLRGLLDIAKKSAVNTKTQKKVTDFFRK